jgi:hypothetical protein
MAIAISCFSPRLCPPIPPPLSRAWPPTASQPSTHPMSVWEMWDLKKQSDDGKVPLGGINQAVHPNPWHENDLRLVKPKQRHTARARLRACRRQTARTSKTSFSKRSTASPDAYTSGGGLLPTRVQGIRAAAFQQP